MNAESDWSQAVKDIGAVVMWKINESIVIDDGVSKKKFECSDGKCFLLQIILPKRITKVLSELYWGTW